MRSDVTGILERLRREGRKEARLNSIPEIHFPFLSSARVNACENILLLGPQTKSYSGTSAEASCDSRFRTFRKTSTWRLYSEKNEQDISSPGLGGDARC